jgi:hypothetical protein
MLDIFNDDAFSLINLTAAINKMDYVPGRAGELAFSGVGSGVSTTTVAIEQKGETLALVSSASRGAPVTQISGVARTADYIGVPFLPLESVIRADEVQNVRAFGSDNNLEAVQAVVNSRLASLVARHDLTLENLRLGALKGQIVDADGSTVLVNLFTKFGVTEETAVNFALTTAGTDVRAKCMQVIRTMRVNAKMALPGSARVHALVGDNFFDALIGHANVKGVYDGYAAAERRLGGDYAHGIFEFGGIFFENYRGSDDSVVGVSTDGARFFWTNAPGVYAEYYAPGDFMETANTIGLPRYAKMAADPSGFNRFVTLHTQQSPLPLCLRPKTLMSATKA